jgi:hypothetical protein
MLELMRGLGHVRRAATLSHKCRIINAILLFRRTHGYKAAGHSWNLRCMTTGRLPLSCDQGTRACVGQKNPPHHDTLA